MRAATITVEARQVLDMTKAMQVIPEFTIQQLTGAVLESQMLLEREAKENAPVGATGTYRASIHATHVKQLETQLLGAVGTSVIQAIPVELGTKPHFPPIEPLVEWVERVLDVSHNEAPHVAFLVARKIARRGTEPQEVFKRTFEENAGQVSGIFRAARDRVAERLAQVKGRAN